MPQTLPVVSGIKAAVEDEAGGGFGSAQDGRVAEGRCVGRPQPQPDRSQPLLGPTDAAQKLREVAGTASPPPRTE